MTEQRKLGVRGLPCTVTCTPPKDKKKNDEEKPSSTKDKEK